MAVSGKGISAAVRDSIKEWITQPVIKKTFQELKKTRPTESEYYFNTMIKNPKTWVRENRVGATNGWIRNYRCNLVKGANLEVKTNTDDTVINYVSIKVNGKVIGGGVVKVPSKLVSQKGRNATIQEETFIPFTEAELEKIQEKSDSDKAISDFLLMFEERVF